MRRRVGRGRTEGVERARTERAQQPLDHTDSVARSAPDHRVDPTTSSSRVGRILIRAVPQVRLCGGTSRSSARRAGAQRPSRSGHACAPRRHLEARPAAPADGGLSMAISPRGTSVAVGGGTDGPPFSAIPLRLESAAALRTPPPRRRYAVTCVSPRAVAVERTSVAPMTADLVRHCAATRARWGRSMTARMHAASSLGPRWPPMPS